MIERPSSTGGFDAPASSAPDIMRDRGLSTRRRSLFQFHFRNIVQAILISSICLSFCLFCILYPSKAAHILSQFSSRSAEELTKNMYDFLRDALVMWAIGIVLIFLDALTRNILGLSLLETLFFKRNNRSQMYMPKLLMATLLVTFVLVPVLILVNLERNSLGLKWLTDEDGLLESGTALNFLIAAIILFSSGLYHVVLRKFRDYRSLAVLAVLCAMMLLVSLEEISWGQRIIGFETPESLVAINDQGEFNIHNLATSRVLQSYIYIACVLLSICIFSYFVMIRNIKFARIDWFMVYLPDPSIMIILCMIVIFSNHILLNDLVEQLASLVVILYSVRLAFRGLTP